MEEEQQKKKNNTRHFIIFSVPAWCILIRIFLDLQLKSLLPLTAEERDQKHGKDGETFD